MKLLSLALCVCSVAGCCILAAADIPPAPTPAPLTPEQVIGLLNSWKEVIFVALAILAAIVSWVIAKVQEIKAQVNRHGERIDGQQAQITGIAVNTPPPPAAPNPAVPPIALVLLCCALLSGCVNGRYAGPPITASATYTTPDGNGTVGGSIRLDPTFAREKK